MVPSSHLDWDVSQGQLFSWRVLAISMGNMLNWPRKGTSKADPPPLPEHDGSRDRTWMESEQKGLGPLPPTARDAHHHLWQAVTGLWL